MNSFTNGLYSSLWRGSSARVRVSSQQGGIHSCPYSFECLFTLKPHRIGMVFALHRWILHP